MWGINMDLKQTTEIICLNPWTNMGCGNELQLKSASSQESAETSGPDYTARWQQDVSSLFLSRLHQSSIYRFSTPSDFLSITLSPSFLAFLPHFLSQFSLACVHEFRKSHGAFCSSAVLAAVVFRTREIREGLWWFWWWPPCQLNPPFWTYWSTLCIDLFTALKAW